MALDVAAIRGHLARLAELVPDDPRWWRGGPIWSEAKLRRFEATHFTLPADYRTWLAVVGDGGVLLMDTEYESWKRYGAMLPLAGCKRAELARAARPFRLVGECIPRRPISGVLHLATHGGAHDRYLVVAGKRAGEVWERSVYTDYCYPIGTFAGMVDDWIDQSTKAAETWAAPRSPATLAAFVPAAQFWQLTGSNLIPWLRYGAEIFVDTFRQLPREDHDRAYFAFEGALGTYVEQLISTPRLAGVAAIALLGVLDERYRPRSELEHALVAIFNAEQPDLSPANVARLIAAVAEGSDHSTANWPAKWLQMALVRDGRLDEALALFRVQPYLLAADWVPLARACVARGRAVEAFAALQALIANPDRPRGERPAAYELAGAWLRLEAGDRPSAIAALERIDDIDIEMFHARDLGSLVTAMRRGREGPPPEFHPSYLVGAVASAFGRTCDYGLVSLLYGVAGDGAHMVDTAIRALSVDAVRRDKQQLANHLAHLRIGQALLGTIERAPRLTVDYGAGSRARLAEAILARVGKLGIVLKRAS